VSLRIRGGRRLQSPPGDIARPTAARVRLAVINRLAPRLEGCRWLDLCCGSGAMACEALQQGAALVVGVERDRRVAAVARANLAAVAAAQGAAACGRVEAAEVVRWLVRGRPQEFDVIYVDPPYRAGLYAAIGAEVARRGWLHPGGTMVWECASKEIPVIPSGWRLECLRNYGGSSVLYLEPDPPGQSPGNPVNSAAQGAATAVLVPGGDEQAGQSDGNQAENNAAEERFDHGSPGRLPGRVVDRPSILP
jgi:16S rRNA (guanine966-N2)-methyltransferase